MAYLRIEESKFWGWVVTALLAGLAIGLAVMFVRGANATSQVSAIKQQLARQAQESSAAITEIQGRLSNAQSQVEALTAQNAQLTSDLAAAKSASTKSSSSSASIGTVTFVSRSVSPESVRTTGTITLTAKVKGHPDKVTMRVAGRTVTFDETYTLKKSSTSGSTETWKRTVSAPNKKGEYRYYATAYVGTTKTVMPGVSAWTFEVK